MIRHLMFLAVRFASRHLDRLADVLLPDEALVPEFDEHISNEELERLYSQCFCDELKDEFNGAA